MTEYMANTRLQSAVIFDGKRRNNSPHSAPYTLPLDTSVRPRTQKVSKKKEEGKGEMRQIRTY